MVYKSLNGLAPDKMHSMFVNRDSVNPYSLRATENKLTVPKPKTKTISSIALAIVVRCCGTVFRLGYGKQNNLINFR
jgi:hypothetical protein